MLWGLEAVIVFSLIVLTAKISIVLGVLALGMRASLTDATFLLRRPGALARAILAMHGVAPIVAVTLALTFALPPPVKIALVALSVSPIPPILPKRILKAGGEHAHTISLLAGSALFAIVAVPLAMAVLAHVFAMPLRMSPLDVATAVLVTVLAPLAIGVAVRAVWPDLAEAIAGPLTTVATVLLALSVVAILFGTGRSLLGLIGDGTLAAFVVFVLLALGTGHLLGGPALEDRTVLALGTATRHPGVAVAIAHANFPEERLAVVAVLLGVMVSVLVSTPYVMWVKHLRGARPSAEGAFDETAPRNGVRPKEQVK